MPFLQFERERMQLFNKNIFLHEILKSPPFRTSEIYEIMHHSTVKINKPTLVSSNKIIILPKYLICCHSLHVIPLIETIPYLSHASSLNFA